MRFGLSRVARSRRLCIKGCSFTTYGVVSYSRDRQYAEYDLTIRMELIEYAGLCLIRGRRLCGFGLHSEPALPRSCSPNLPPRYAKNSILISGSHSENRLGLVCEKTLYAAKLYPFHAEALRSSDGRNSEEKRSTPTRPRTTALSCVRHMPPDTATLGRYSTFRCFESRSTEESLPCKGYTVS